MWALTLHQGLSKFFCKRPESKYIRYCGPYGLYHNYVAIYDVVTWKSSQTKYRQINVTMFHYNFICKTLCGLQAVVCQFLPCTFPQAQIHRFFHIATTFKKLPCIKFWWVSDYLKKTTKTLLSFPIMCEARISLRPSTEPAHHNGRNSLFSKRKIRFQVWNDFRE